MSGAGLSTGNTKTEKTLSLGSSQLSEERDMSEYNGNKDAAVELDTKCYGNARGHQS